MILHNEKRRVMKWIGFIAFVVLISACDPDGSTIRSDRSAGDVDTQDDSVFVSGVGHLSKEEAYRRLMDYGVWKGQRIYGDQVDNYAQALLRSGGDGAVDSLLAFADRYPKSGSMAFAYVIEEKSPKFPPWLRKNTDRLDSHDWAVVAASVQRAEWRDSTVMRVLMEQAIQGAGEEGRFPAIDAFAGIGTLDEVRTLATLADTTNSSRARWIALGTLPRFDAPDLNERLRRDLQELDVTSVFVSQRKFLPFSIRESLKRYARHDFLPDVQQVRARVQEKANTADQSDIERIIFQEKQSQSRRALQKIDELIAHLKEKKAAGAPVGVPLDWPETTWEDKEGERSDNDGN
jgi:hypothetical protein